MDKHSGDHKQQWWYRCAVGCCVEARRKSRSFIWYESQMCFAKQNSMAKLLWFYFSMIWKVQNRGQEQISGWQNLNCRERESQGVCVCICHYVSGTWLCMSESQIDHHQLTPVCENGQCPESPLVYRKAGKDWKNISYGVLSIQWTCTNM